MVKCVFCGKEESSFKGVHLVKNDGSVNYFCSGKCRKNSTKLKRDRRKVRWAEAFHVVRDKAREKLRIKAEEVKQKESEKSEKNPKKK